MPMHLLLARAVVTSAEIAVVALATVVCTVVSMKLSVLSVVTVLDSSVDVLVVCSSGVCN